MLSRLFRFGRGCRAFMLPSRAYRHSKETAIAEDSDAEGRRLRRIQRSMELLNGLETPISSGYGDKEKGRGKVVPLDDIFADSLRKMPMSSPAELAPLERLSRPHAGQAGDLSLLDGVPDGRDYSRPRAGRQAGSTKKLAGRHAERLVNMGTPTKHKSFSEMDLPTWLIGALANLDIVQPTAVQQRLIETILDSGRGGKSKKCKSVLVKGHTGTGKSLGYIIALLARMHRERQLQTLATNVTSCYHLVLVPNDILAQQLVRWIKMLVQDNAYLGKNLDKIVRTLTRETAGDESDGGDKMGACSLGFSHILIATPSLVRTLLAKGQFNVAALKTIIADEGDALLKTLSQYATDKEKRNRLKHPVPAMTLLKELQGICVQRDLEMPLLIVSSASLSYRCREELHMESLIDPAVTLLLKDHTQRAACPPAIIHHHRMLANSQSIEELMQLVSWIWTERAGELGVVFVPAARSKTAMQGWLETVGIRSLVLSELPTGDYQALQKAMAVTGEAGDEAPLLLGSDVDARGWDLPDLRYVIVVDLPESPTHYLHMAGRVGRMGAPGTVYTFVAGQVDFQRLTNMYSLLRLSSTPFIPKE